MSLELINQGLAIARSLERSAPEASPSSVSPTESRLNAAWRVVVGAPPGVHTLRMTYAAWVMEAQAAPTESARDAALAAAKAIDDKLTSIRTKAQP